MPPGKTDNLFALEGGVLIQTDTGFDALPTTLWSVSISGTRWLK